MANSLIYKTLTVSLILGTMLAGMAVGALADAATSFPMDQMTQHWVELLSFIVSSVAVIATLKQQSRDADRRAVEQTAAIVKLQGDAKEDREKMYTKMEILFTNQSNLTASLEKTVAYIEGFSTLENERHTRVDLSIAKAEAEMKIVTINQSQIFQSLGELSGKIDLLSKRQIGGQ